MGTSVYPGALDDFAEASPPYLADEDTTGRDHPARHDDLEAAMEAVQGELGTDPAGGSATVKARLDTADSTVSALTSTVAGKVKGYNASTEPGSPTTGDLWVNSSNQEVKVYDGAAWVDPSNAGGIADAVISGTPTGTYTDAGIDYAYYEFTASGTLTVTRRGSLTCWSLVVVAAARSARVPLTSLLAAAVLVDIFTNSTPISPQGHSL
jgi:hypothetical protein